MSWNEGTPRVDIGGTARVVRGSADLQDPSSGRRFAGGSVETWSPPLASLEGDLRGAAVAES